MARRQKVPPNVARGLWAESMGHCMNPDCHRDLLQEGSNVGEMAHIVPHVSGGEASLENMILLCPTCHTQIDSNKQGNSFAILREWKCSRNREIRIRFTQKYGTFEELENFASPLLRRNLTIFNDYGPADASPVDPERHLLWEKFEHELVSNNARLDAALMANKRLFHRGNIGLVDEFHAHCREFVETREDTPILRRKLFPKGLLSVFAVAEHTADAHSAQDISTLQNFIAHLVDEGQFVRLQMTPTRVLTYRKDADLVTLNLEDGPRVRQIFWSGEFYEPKTSKILWDGWVFFLDWLHKNGIHYTFQNVSNLSEITLNGKHRVKLYYEYCLSLSNLQEIELVEGLNVVNIYNWNGGPYTPEAMNFAEQVRVNLFNQKEFFAYAHRNIK